MIDNPMINDERFLTLSEVEKITGFKKTFIYQQGDKGNFPQRRKIGKSARWLLSEIKEWMASQPQKKTQSV